MKRLLAKLWAVTLFPLTMSAQINLTVDMQKKGVCIDPLHYGIFFEDINHAADGGLYAELIRNRSFEDNDSLPSYWKLEAKNSSATMKLTDHDLLNKVQKKSLCINVLSVSKKGVVSVSNSGFWGINSVKGRKYKVSFWAKADNYAGNLFVALQDKTGDKNYAKVKIRKCPGDTWKKYEAEFRANANDGQARFSIILDGSGTVFLDMVSLFPPTFKNRENGCRPELAELLADLNPTFMRFPGGCFVEGEVIDGKLEQFKWKETVGPIEERSSHVNVWRYPVTNGLGYHEYLQLAEDLGVTPMYVTNAGIWHGGFAPHDSIDWYIQDALDSIEYANGDASTKYGAMRIANGHPEPFGMYLIEVGNENYQKNVKQQSDHYPERYIQFYKAIKKKYPYMKIIGNVDAFDFNPQWRNNHPVDYVDEHYYRNPRWFIDRYKKYDVYDRRGPKVYVGEYAVTKEYGVNGNLNAALGEAVFMMGMERNGDVVKMTSYAPIFKNENEARWNPDMIHFDSDEVFVTPSYHVQRMFANNVGDYNIECIEENNVYPTEACPVKYSVDSELRDADTSRKYTSMKRFRYSDEDKEGVKIYFHYKNENEYGVWHLAADNNRRYNLELHEGKEISMLAYKYNGILENGKFYDAQVVVNGGTVKCYLNGELVHKVNLYPEQWVYTSASMSSDEKTCFLKIVNPTDKNVVVNISFKNMLVKDARIVRLSSDKGTDENSMENKECVNPVDMGVFSVVNGILKLEIPAFSLDIIKCNEIEK